MITIKTFGEITGDSENNDPTILGISHKPEDSSQLYRSLLKKKSCYQKIGAFLVVMLVLGSAYGLLKYRTTIKETSIPELVIPSREDQLESDVDLNSDSNWQPLSNTDFDRLYPGWMLLKQEALSLQTDNYCIVVMARYHDEYNNNVRIAVCKNTGDQWKPIWYIPKDLSCQGFTADDLGNYPDSYTPDMMITTDANKALVAANIIKGGQGVTQVVAFVLDDKGKGIVEMEDSFGPMSLDREGNKIKITGEGSYGIHIISLDNGLFKQRKVPRSQMAPPISVEAHFTVSENNTVYPLENQLKLQVGQTIAFIPDNDKAKEMFDSGEVSIYSDKGYPPVRTDHASEIGTGNYYTFDKPGVFNFLLQGPGNIQNFGPTFTITVEP